MASKRDIILFVVTMLLVTIGGVMVYSSSSIIALEKFGNEYHFLKKQIIFVLMGFCAMIALSQFPYYYWKKLAYPGMIFSFILLLLLLIPGIGVKVGGAVRWLKVGGFSFQVTELVKILLVVFLAHYLAKKKEHLKEDLRTFVVPLAVSFVVVCLVLAQPDFGTSVIMITVLMIMLYMAGSRMLYLAGLAAVSIPVGVIVIMREGYRMKRLMAFLDPWGDPGNSGFQIIQSFIAFGSGGAFGVGLGNSMQKLFYLPEPHTDFIISVIGEEGGFLWVSIVIVLFAILVFRGFMISFRSSDVFATLLSAGLTTVIALEVSINVAGVMGLIPTKGLALPFLSYGGTSLIMSMASVGILLNISFYCGSHAGKEERLEGGD